MDKHTHMHMKYLHKSENKYIHLMMVIMESSYLQMRFLPNWTDLELMTFQKVVSLESIGAL